MKHQRFRLVLGTVLLLLVVLPTIASFWFSPADPNAMSLGQLPMFNAAYADKTGNIYYLYNGVIPIRDPNYDWSGYLPGDTSKTLWTQYLPFDQLPQVLNPPAGFIQNANGSPFRTTLGTGNPDPNALVPQRVVECQVDWLHVRRIQRTSNSADWRHLGQR